MTLSYHDDPSVAKILRPPETVKTTSLVKSPWRLKSALQRSHARTSGIKEIYVSTVPRRYRSGITQI